MTEGRLAVRLSRRCGEKGCLSFTAVGVRPCDDDDNVGRSASRWSPTNHNPVKHGLVAVAGEGRRRSTRARAEVRLTLPLLQGFS